MADSDGTPESYYEGLARHVRPLLVHCDACLDEYRSTCFAVYRRDQRPLVEAALTEEGWLVDGGRHICPPCRNRGHKRPR